MEAVGSLICMAKFPWAAHSAAHWAAHFFIFGSSGLPTELPTVSIYGSSGQPYLHGKIPMGSPRAAHSVDHVQPMGSEVGGSPVFFFRMGAAALLLLVPQGYNNEREREREITLTMVILTLISQPKAQVREANNMRCIYGLDSHAYIRPCMHDKRIELKKVNMCCKHYAQTATK